eukprot:TRINITY_DN11162_c0_g1_i1.p1 TRINITY_DN11162_c0_g1~~TRINITY_DN11162_c0_g1_i1.p1  ORF type:complete len:377 (-),score=76.16 TRINITY_DN11162_c0_g1_i1:107-1237(-)
MPEPLIPFKLYDSFITASSNEVSNTSELRRLISFLPPENLAIFTALIIHLNKLAKYVESNYMSESNIAIVFAPNLLRPEVESPEVFLGDARASTMLFTTIITDPMEYLSSRPTAGRTPATTQQFDYDAFVLKQGMDPLEVAHYMDFYQSQGMEEATAKQWAIYYISQQSSSATSSSTEAPPSSSTSSAHSSNPPRGMGPRSQSQPVIPAILPSRPLPTTTNEKVTPSRSVGSASLPSPTSTPPTTSPGVPRRPVPPSPTPTKRSLPIKRPPKTPTTGGPPTLRVSLSASPAAGVASRRPGRPPPPSISESSVVAKAPPRAARAAKSRLEQVRRTRSQSIAHLRKSVGGGDAMIKKMMEQYRNGDSSVLEHLQKQPK